MKRFLIIFFVCSFVYPVFSYGQTIQSSIPEAYRTEWSALRPKLDANIEKYRKGDAIIELVDEKGNPIKKASIDIKQKNHDFIFGCNSFVIGQLGDMNEDYEHEFAKLFNLATTTFCFGDYCSELGKYRFGPEAEDVWRRPVPDKIVDFGKKYGIKLKGQPLLKDSHFPEWGKGMSADQARSVYVDFFQRSVKALFQ